MEVSSTARTTSRRGRTAAPSSRSAAARAGAGHTEQYTEATPTATSLAPPRDSSSAANARVSFAGNGRAASGPEE